MTPRIVSEKEVQLGRAFSTEVFANDPFVRYFLPYHVSNSKTKSKTKDQTIARRGILRPSTQHAKNFIATVEKIIDHAFKDSDILEEALEAPGSGWRLIGESKKMVKGGNARLAMVGEDALRLIIGEHCYKIGLDCEDSAKAMTEVLSKKNLDSVGRESRLESYIRMGRSSQASGILRVTSKDKEMNLIMSTTKAVVGAVYCDGGLDAAKKTVFALRIGQELGVDAV